MKISALRNGKSFSAHMAVETAAKDADPKKERVVSDWSMKMPENRC